MPVTGAIMVPHPPMILPQVGRGSEKQIEKTTLAYRQAAQEIAALSPETIIISSPHTVMYADYFHISPGKEASGSFARFGAPDAAFHETYDTELVQMIQRIADDRGFPAGTLGERDRSLDHGTMVPLYFIRQYCKDFRLVRIGLSGLPLAAHYAMGQIIREAVERTGRRAVFVASGDLSHKLQDYGPYGFAKEGPVYDEKIMDVCGRGAFGELLDFPEDLCERAAECGHRSFVMMAGALDGMAVEAKALSHEDVTGVGYGVCTFRPLGEDAGRRFLEKEKSPACSEQEDPLVRLARLTIKEHVLGKRKNSLPDWVPDELRREKAGVFVSVHEDGRLRGCIGTILPVTGCIAEEIRANAVSAVSRDPRFSPVGAWELDRLEISVDVLTKPEKIAGPDELDVKKYGVIVSRGGRRGLLLPDLEGIDSVDEQIRIAKQKAGIREDEVVTLERFEVIRHK